MHSVKPEWLKDQNIQWKRDKPKQVCDLHFSEDSFTSNPGKKKYRYLKHGSKPLSNLTKSLESKSRNEECSETFISTTYLTNPKVDKQNMKECQVSIFKPAAEKIELVRDSPSNHAEHQNQQQTRYHCD